MSSINKSNDDTANFLKIANLSASYADEQVISNISFTLGEGELACLLGPSGCGKTTILRAISGFQQPAQGSIYLNGQLLADGQNSVSPEQRNVGMVFQDHALFPHLSVAENVGFGLSKLSNDDKQNRVNTMLDLVGMGQQSQRYPHELSGGQNQRIALARAIAPQPSLLLMDEPFSNLDTELRESLGYEVRKLLKELGMTAIMVTHDQHDAFSLGDQVGVMSQGALLQWDTSFNLYHAPNSRFIANFIGDGVFIRGQIQNNDVVNTNFGEVRGEIHSEAIDGCHNGKEVDLLIRPDDVKHNPNSSIRGQVARKAFKGAQTLYTINMDSGDTLMSLVPSHDDYQVGDIVGLQIDADHLVCFEPGS